MYIEKSALLVTLIGYNCIWVTLTCKGKIQIRSHLFNEGLEGLESFALVFLCRNTAFFTYMVCCKQSAMIHDMALIR